MLMHNPPHPGEIIESLCLQQTQYGLWHAQQRRSGAHW